MATSPVPMFDPTGTVRMIQPDQVDAATQSGGLPAVKMIDPQGEARYVRQDQQQDALNAGGKLAPPDQPAGPPKSLLEKELDWVQGLPGMQMASGAMKGIEKTAAGALENIATNLGPQAPGVNPAPVISEQTRAAMNAPLIRGAQATAKWLRQNTDTQGWEKVGDVGQAIGQLVYAPELLESEVAPDASRAFSYAQSLLQDAKRAKWFEDNPNIARILRIGLHAVRGGAEMGGQTYVTSGGNVPETEAAMKSGVIGGGAGGVVTEAGTAALDALGRKAGELMPAIENLGSGDYRVLRSEATGPQGQPLATALQREAADISGQPQIRAERVAALQNMPPSLARSGLESALNESEANRVAGPFGAEPPIAAQPVQAAWDHTTPDGRSLNPDQAREELANVRSQWLATDNDPAAEQQLEQQYGDLKNKLNLHDRFQATEPTTGVGNLSPEDAKAALENLKTRWLAEDWGPQQDAQFKQVYNQLQQQVDRNDSYLANRSMTQPFNIQNALANTHSFGDAADHLDLAARQRLQYLSPDLQQQYQGLAAARTRLQDKFDKATGLPLEQARILPQIDAANRQLEDFFTQDGVRGVLPRNEAAQALKDLHTANGFKALDNVFEKHFTLRPSTATAITEPSMPAGSLAKDIEKVRDQYGDVLDSALGPDGLNHIIKLGEQTSTKAGDDAVQGLGGNIMAAYKRHFRAIGGMSGAAILDLMYHTGAHALGLGALPAALAVASGAGARKYLIQRLATDPKFGEAMMYAARQGIPPRVAGAILASRLGVSKLVAPLFRPASTGATDATGQPNPQQP